MPRQDPNVAKAGQLLPGQFLEDLIGPAEGADVRARQRQMEEEDALFAQAQVRERLAAYAHDAWAGWMVYMFDRSVSNGDGSMTVPPALVARWKRQAGTPYADLPANEQASDRAEADKMLALMHGVGGA